MKIPQSALPPLRLLTLAAFTSACAGLFGYLWVNSGGDIPGITGGEYRVTVHVADVDNLVYFSDVRMAGVRVGKVQEIENTDGGTARVVLALDREVAPLHEGVTMRMGAKTLIEETYVDVRDGNGPPLPDGSMLADSTVTPGVQLDDVLGSLDPEAREALGSALRSFGAGTEGRREDVTGVVQGLGALGREGRTALDALAAQSEDLKALSANTTELLQALDTRQGQVATMVVDAQRITDVTAGGNADIEATMRELPGVLGSAGTASTRLTELSGALGPVAANLDAAAPFLSTALDQLPAVSSDLRGLLPPLAGTLDAAPSTLDRVPTFGQDARALIPPARVALSDLNPMLGYLQPYGPDLAAFFTNWSAGLANSVDVHGRYARPMFIFSEQSLRSSPVPTDGVVDRSNAYPTPGQSNDPAPFDGPYPRVERDGG
ncbi:MlaD family protein [Pseudonocardia sp. H11422]|uniref:MlaD family protein n=1 Tax=Pseudonocardia sp. H11422 TaxID=2835866 RepID=UPI001BDBCA5C|nr:MlaD family protein [Pseudonocardia sp. H11422]